MAKTIFLIRSLLILITFIGCNSDRVKEKRLNQQFIEGEILSREFSNIFLKEDENIKNMNEDELTELASRIYVHIGTPTVRQDTQRLYVAIDYLDKALTINPSNRTAYRYKLDIQTTMQDWQESLKTVDDWLIRGVPHYYDHMLKGFIYSKSGNIDSSRLAFMCAMELLNREVPENLSVSDKIQKVILISLLEGDEKGLDEINALIKETDSETAKMIREEFFYNLDQMDYIDRYVFGKPEELKR